MKTTPILTSAPAAEPLTLVQAKAHLRVEVADDDALITTLISAAREWSQQYTGRLWITQTWRIGIPQCEVEELYELDGLALPLHPVQSATVTYYDESDAAQTLAGSSYYLDVFGEAARVVLKSSVTPPIVNTDRPTPIYVDAVCGYGASAASIPSGLREALQASMLLQIGTLYAQREELVVGTIAAAPAPVACERLLGPYRLARSLVGLT